MAGVISPTYKVRIHDSLENPSAELFYLITGTESETDVYNLIQGVLTATYFNFYLTDYEFEHKGAGCWDAKVIYGGTLPQTDGSITWQLDFSGGSERRRQSFSTTKYGPTGLPIPDYQGAINVHDGQVEGVDVPVPMAHITKTAYFDVDNLTPNQIQYAYDLNGCINDAPLSLVLDNGQTLNVAAGDALYRGAVISQKGIESWCFNYKLEVRKGRSIPLKLIGTGGAITNTTINLGGHDYLWVYYENQTSNSALVKVPKFAYVEQVYPKGDLSKLNL